MADWDWRVVHAILCCAPDGLYAKKHWRAKNDFGPPVAHVHVGQ